MADCGFAKGIEAAARAVYRSHDDERMTVVLDLASVRVEALVTTHDPESCRECKVLAATEAWLCALDLYRDAAKGSIAESVDLLRETEIALECAVRGDK